MNERKCNDGLLMHAWATDLFPICRSLTGEGVRTTLAYLGDILPDLRVHSVPTGTKAFDWVVPEEWIIRSGYVADINGNILIDFKSNNLHIVGYSIAVDDVVSREVLFEHLYSLPEQPDAIPYITSYYSRTWGFCCTHAQQQLLVDDYYRVFIDSEHTQGFLNYGELIVPGQLNEEVFISTYICHPSMANNELSGPVVATRLAQYVASITDRRYTYRFVFVPETIGSVVYVSKNLEHLKQHVIAGFNVSCIGDNRAYSFLPSRSGNTISDTVAKHVLKHIDSAFVQYSWLDRGSDERQYCAPHVDLPVASIMRTKYGMYPEYHTSLDDLENVVTPDGLQGGFDALRSAIDVIEQNFYPVISVYCEPQLGKRGLYPNVSTKSSGATVKLMMDVISLCDGQLSVLDIAELLDCSFKSVLEIIHKLQIHGLVTDRGSE